MMRLAAERLVQLIIFTCVFGMSVGALRTSAQVTEAQFTRNVDEARSAQFPFHRMIILRAIYGRTRD